MLSCNLQVWCSEYFLNNLIYSKPIHSQYKYQLFEEEHEISLRERVHSAPYMALSINRTVSSDVLERNIVLLSKHCLRKGCLDRKTKFLVVWDCAFKMQQATVIE